MSIHVYEYLYYIVNRQWKDQNIGTYFNETKQSKRQRTTGKYEHEENQPLQEMRPC